MWHNTRKRAGSGSSRQVQEIVLKSAQQVDIRCGKQKVPRPQTLTGFQDQRKFVLQVDGSRGVVAGGKEQLGGKMSVVVGEQEQVKSRRWMVAG